MILRNNPFFCAPIDGHIMQNGLVMVLIPTNTRQLEIGQDLMDWDGFDCVISNLTRTTVEVSIPRKTKQGINCKQWFQICNFYNRFRTDKYYFRQNHE
jgi:hypothetical protein